MKTILDVIFVSILFAGGYFVAYSCFSVTLFDDVAFNYGKHRVRNRRRKNKGFWKKFFFLDIKDEVIKWHYALFWIHLCSYIPAFILAIIFVVGVEQVRTALSVFLVISWLPQIIDSFVRWDLYKGNVVRSKESYRKNNRKSKRR